MGGRFGCASWCDMAILCPPASSRVSLVLPLKAPPPHTHSARTHTRAHTLPLPQSPATLTGAAATRGDGRGTCVRRRVRAASGGAGRCGAAGGRGASAAGGRPGGGGAGGGEAGGPGAGSVSAGGRAGVQRALSAVAVHQRARQRTHDPPGWRHQPRAQGVCVCVCDTLSLDSTTLLTVAPATLRPTGTPPRQQGGSRWRGAGACRLAQHAMTHDAAWRRRLIDTIAATGVGNGEGGRGRALELCLEHVKAQQQDGSESDVILGINSKQ